MEENKERKALTIPPVEELKTVLETRRMQYLSAKSSSYPRKNPILSDIGDCDRQIAYGVANWQDKPVPGVELQARFEAGKDSERIMTRQLLEMDFDFVGAQDTVTIQGKGGVLLATGRIDGFIKWQGEKIPVEFKSMHPNIYNQIDTLEDFQKKPWLRKYIRQLMLYMFGHNKEYGLFGLTNCLGGVKWLVLYLDLGECEHLLQRLEKVQAHLAAGTLPDRIEYRDDICGRCDFATTCLQDVMRTEAEILTDDALLAQIERRDQLLPSHQEYEKLDKAVKKALVGIRKGIAGDFMINGKEVERAGYQVADTKYWTTSIKRLGARPE